MTRSVGGTALSALAALTTACGGETPAEGALHEVVAVASADRWSELADAVSDAIERRVSGVSDERVFTVVHQEPYGEGWEARSRAPLLVLIGTLQDPWIQEAVALAEPRPHEPGLSRVLDVWAEGQVANVLVLPESGEAGDRRELEEHLEGVYAQLHADLRAMVRTALYASGAQTELADTLWENEGFGVLIPDDYAWSRTDSTFLFWPEGEGAGADVEQRIAVTWMNPAPPSLEIDEVLAWRERTAREHYGTPQEVTDLVTAERLAFAGYIALEVRGQWMRRTESGEREQGPLLTRVAVCEGQNRAYLLDSWLHTTAAETYEHVVQLETILDTFRCE
jgi:hypothetical protein